MTIHNDLPQNDRVKLTFLRARNFLSLHDIRLDIGPKVTVLAGPNASGKSSIVDAMSFVSDAIYDGVGRAVGYRGTRAILHRHGGKVSPWFSMELGLESATFKATHLFRVRIERDGEVSIKSERLFGETRGPGGRPFDFPLIRDDTHMSDAFSGLNYHSDSLMLSVMGDSLVVAKLIVSSLMGNGDTTDESAVASVAQSVVDMTDFIGDMRYYRLFPNMMREPKPPKAYDMLEEDGANLPSVLNSLVRQNGDSYRQLLGALTRVVPDIEDVRVRETGGYQYIQLKHRSLTTDGGNAGWLNISNESDGTVRTLGLFVALYQDPSPSLIGIEEPELNVHVGALEVLADTLNEVGLRSQLVIATHSSDLLDFFEEDTLRAVISEEGRTKTGRLRSAQAEALREALFTAGELHRVEGLSIDLEGD